MLWTNNCQPPLGPWPEGSWVINGIPQRHLSMPSSLSDLFWVDSSRLCNSNLCQLEIKEIPGGFGHRTLVRTFHNLFMSSPCVTGLAEPSRRSTVQGEGTATCLMPGGQRTRPSGLKTGVHFPLVDSSAGT